MCLMHYAYYMYAYALIIEHLCIANKYGRNGATAKKKNNSQIVKSKLAVAGQQWVRTGHKTHP